MLIDAPTDQLLPAGVLVQPGVFPDSDIDCNNFTVFIQNESKKTISIPVGTVIAEIRSVDTVTPIQPSDLIRSFRSRPLQFWGFPYSRRVEGPTSAEVGEEEECVLTA